VQLDFLPRWQRQSALKPDTLLIGAARIPLEFVRNPRARRYVLRVPRAGAARVTIPRGGSIAYALEFARDHRAWIAQQLERRRAEAARPKTWLAGTQILFRGESVTLTCEPYGEILLVRFGDQTLTVTGGTIDLRPSLEHYLWALADKLLGPRTLQLAAQNQLNVGRVVVRNQRSRWGSCSPRRTISLNWRLIQTPEWVQDYLIIHELMHLREMNHSPRYWRLVKAAFPDYPKAEAWLNAHVFLLR
jgi:predicted metal-dependent hydrolase